MKYPTAIVIKDKRFVRPVFFERINADMNKI